MHITLGVLLVSKLWEEIQEQNCSMLAEFYRKVGKHLQTESSKGVLHKSQDPKSRKTKEKKEDKKRKNGVRKDKSSKKPRTENNKVENRYFARYTNYTPLNAPMDHIFAVTRTSQYLKNQMTLSRTDQREMLRNTVDTARISGMIPFDVIH